MKLSGNLTFRLVVPVILGCPSILTTADLPLLTSNTTETYSSSRRAGRKHPWWMTSEEPGPRLGAFL